MDSKASVLLVPLLPHWPDIPAALLVGVSDDPDQIDDARLLAESLGRSNCLFVLGSPDDIPWRDAFFDTIYTTGKSTPELRRVIKPEGTIHECQNAC